MSKHILILSTADWNFKYWTNKQNVAQELSRKGFKVIYVESPGIRKPNFFNKNDFNRLIIKLRSFFFQRKSKNRNIKIISPPLIPYKEKFKLLYKIYNFILEKKILNELKKKKISSLSLITYHPYFQFDRLNPYVKKLIYHCVDDLSSVKGINKKEFKLNEKILVKKCNFIFTCCSLLFYNFKRLNKNVFFLKNAISNEFIKASKKNYQKIPTELKYLKSPIFGYHGIFSDFKLDFKTYYQLANKYKLSNFVFIGDEFELNKNLYFKKLKKLLNVHILNYKSYLDLPRYLKNIDYGLLLYKKNSYTQNMFPLKINELLACKTNVIISNIPSANHFKNQIIMYKKTKDLKIITKPSKAKKFDLSKSSYSYLVNEIVRISNL